LALLWHLTWEYALQWKPIKERAQLAIRKAGKLSLAAFLIIGALISFMYWYGIKRGLAELANHHHTETAHVVTEHGNSNTAVLTVKPHPQPEKAVPTNPVKTPTVTPIADPVGNLSKLGWAIKRDGKILQFEVAYTPLPNMQQSAVFFRGLREPFRLSFQGVPNLNGLNELSSIEECREVQISASDLMNLDELRGFASLRKLTITQVPLNAHNDLDISSLQSLTSLEILILNSSRATSLDPVQGMRHLRSLNIGNTLIRDLSPIKELTELKTVDVGGSKVVDLSPLIASKGLEELGIDAKQVHSLDALSPATQLRQLRLFDWGSVDLTPIGQLSHLESLFITGLQTMDLTFLRKLPNLINLQITGFGPPVAEISQITELAAICANGGPRTLTLSSLQVNSLSFISTCTKLSELNLSQIPIASLSELSGMSTLKKISLINIPIVEISPLLSLPNLESISLIRVPARADVISELERRGVKVSNP